MDHRATVPTHNKSTPRQNQTLNFPFNPTTAMFSPTSSDSSRHSSSTRSSPPSSPTRRAALAVSDVANIFVNMRRTKERSKSHHIISSSGDRPQTHPSLLGEGVTCGEQVDMELNDEYICSGAVDVVKLLRASRIKLLHQAKYLNGNVLLDEQ